MEKKLELISQIIEITSKISQPSGSQFDELYDMTIPELYFELVKTTDKVYYILSGIH